MRKWLLTVAVTLPALFAGSIAAAAPQTANSKRSSANIAALTACRAQTDDRARLACYDEVAAALSAAASDGSVIVMDRQEAQKMRRSLFGFSLPDLPFLRSGGGGEELKEVEASIRSASTGKSGAIVYTMDDGSVWRTVEGKFPSTKVGQVVRIRRASLGSYFLSAGGRSIRAIRVR